MRDAPGEHGALLLGRAERGDPAGEAARRGALGLEERAQREEVVAQRLGRDGAVAAHLEPPQRPRDLAAARGAAGDEAAERAQLVLLLGRDDERRVGAVADRAERERLPGAAAGARPGERAEGEAAGLEEAQRGEQPAQPDAGVGDGRGVAGGRLPAQHGEQVRPVGAGGPDGVAGRLLAERVAADERQAVAEGEVGRGDLEPEQRRDDDRLGPVVVDRGLDLVQRALEAAVLEDEVGRVLEDAAEERAQRRLGALPRVARRGLAARLEVDLEPAAVEQRAERGQVARQPAEQAHALRDEAAGERAVAVQRAVAPPRGDDVERQVGPLARVRLELPGGLLGERGERGVELTVAHGCCGSPGAAGLLLRAARVARARAGAAAGGALSRPARARGRGPPRAPRGSPRPGTRAGAPRRPRPRRRPRPGTRRGRRA